MQNLDPNTADAETLQQAFATYGRVKSAVLVKGQGGQNTGAAYVHFEDDNSAKVSACLQDTFLKDPVSLI